MQDIKDLKCKVIQAALDLAKTKSWADISMYQISQQAGVLESDVLIVFEDKESVLAGYMSSINKKIESMFEQHSFMDESPRDRIFDLIMERLDLLNNHKTAVISFVNSVSLDPKQIFTVLPNISKAMAQTLVLANENTHGIKGAVKVTALTTIYLKVLRFWINDETDDMAPTMACLDKALSFYDKI